MQTENALTSKVPALCRVPCIACLGLCQMQSSICRLSLAECAEQHRSAPEAAADAVLCTETKACDRRRVLKWLKGFAEERGLAWQQDAIGNLVIKRTGSGGGESAPPVIIQARCPPCCMPKHVFDAQL